MTTTAVELHPAPGIGAPARIEDMKAFLARLNSPEGFEEQQQLALAYDKACSALIGPNDVQLDGDREFKKKSAWRKLGRYFSLSTVVVSSKVDYIADPDVNSDRELILVATVVVRAIAVWGQHSEAIGVCATDEEIGQRVITIADALATAETRATNRAISNLIAMGEVSAEEVQRADGSSKSNAPPQRQKKPAGDIKVPFGPSKGTKLRDMTTSDLSGAVEWAEDKPRFTDFVAAGREELESRRTAAGSSSNGNGAPAAKTDAKELGLSEAYAFPFPFQKGKANHGKPLSTFSTPHLQEVKNWIIETQREKGDEEFHSQTVRAIDLILADREKDQTKLDLGSTEGVVTHNAGTPFEAVAPVDRCKRPAGHAGPHLPHKTAMDDALIAGMPEKGGKYNEETDDCRLPLTEGAKTSSLPPSSPQEAKSPAAAPSGGGPQPPKAPLDGDPTSKSTYYARIRKALESAAITPETRELYHQDNVNGFKGPGRHSIDWWVEKLEKIAASDPDSFPSALEDTSRPGKDGLPF